MKKIHKTLFLFIIGFMTYITIEVCWRGYSYPLMGLCGGIAFVLIDKINDEISWDIDILVQGLIGSFIITLMEFIIGTLSLHGVIQQMWNYSNLPFNYKGIICLPFSIIWFFLSIVAVVLADFINYYILNEDGIPYYRLFGKIVYKFKKKEVK